MLEVNRGAGTEVRDEGRTTPINHAVTGAKFREGLERVEDEGGGVRKICHLGGEHSAKLARAGAKDTHAQTHPIPLVRQEVAKLLMNVVPERRLVEPRRDHGRVGVGHFLQNGQRWGDGFYESGFAGDVRLQTICRTRAAGLRASPRQSTLQPTHAMWLD